MRATLRQSVLRQTVGGAIVLICLLISCNPTPDVLVTAEGITVTDLQCEMLTEPLGIDAINPRLSWKIKGEQRGINQLAYQILVASSREKLDAGDGDLWNSGKVVDQSIHVSYNGRQLESRKPYFWKVKVWTSHGHTGWSEAASWSMGLLYFKDWDARWIGFDRAFPWDHDSTFSRLSARYYRKEFEVQKKVSRATAYIMGLGLYELYFNGEKVGDQVLAPSPTDYSKNVKYNTFDVTSLLRNGNNAVGVTLGNGRFYSMRRHYKPYKIKDFGFPRLLFQLEIEYQDGTTRTIKTDDSWKGTADGPIRSNNEYDGEEYDARKEMPGWNAVGFAENGWLDAEYVSAPGGEYEAQMNDNMTVMDMISPVGITRMPGDKYILDMGQNMVGWVQMKVEGLRGTRVKLRFAESLQDNGELFVANLRDARATDFYTLKGGGQETWEPKFVYHGFRFVEVSGYPGEPGIEDFFGKVIYDRMRTVGSFETSDTTINTIYENAWWSIAGNYKGMPIDCPQRNERQPWLGDRSTSAYGENFMFDNGRLYAKWLDDIRFTQKSDGALCDVAPPYFQYYSDNMTWPGTFILVADMLHHQTGDIQVIANNYSSMKKWLDYMKVLYMTDDYIVTKDSYGDWCPPPPTIEAGMGKSGNVKHPSQLISTAYYYHYTGIMTRFARLLKLDGDVEYFRELGGMLKNAFHERFFNSEKGYYGDNLLTDNLLPLYFKIVPEKEIERVFNNIVHTIEVTNDGHLSSGIVGTQWLMRSLTEYGRPDLAFQLATTRTYPSWGYMLENGATTIWELWNGNTAAPNMNSQNHVMQLGDLIVWFYEDLGGIKALEPGFKKILMDPEWIKELEFVNCSYESVHGKISSHWTKNEQEIQWEIAIPPNTSAEVRFPVTNVDQVTEIGKNLKEVEGVENIMEAEGELVVTVGSGNYQFKVNLNQE